MVGKIGMPESILNKPAALDEMEIEIVKKHPERGWEMLHAIHRDWSVGERDVECLQSAILHRRHLLKAHATHSESCCTRCRSSITFNFTSRVILCKSNEERQPTL